VSTTFDLAREYVAVHCGIRDNGCDVEFAMTRHFYEETRRTGQAWYCPNGHRRVWGGPTTDQKLRDAETREVALTDQLAAAVRDAETVRVALLRDRQRFANGVCPCCNRSFGNVRRHMATQHPDYDPTRVEQASTVRFACSCGRVFETLRGLRIHQGRLRGAGWDQPGKSRWSAHLTKVAP
jgi:hypothetical protein